MPASTYTSFGGHSMVARLRVVAVKRPEEAYRSQAAIEDEWRGLGYTRPPDLQVASRDHAHLVSLLEAAGAEVLALPEADDTGLDSIYVHDPLLGTDAGAVILRTGKPERRREGAAFERSLKHWGMPILGSIDDPGTAEAGDMVWIDPGTLVVGRGFRTNPSGIAQLTALLQPLGIEVMDVALPYWNGPGEVLHLMSFISMLDRNLAIVYRRLLPVPLFELLTERGIELIDVPDEEFGSQGTNVLALSPRQLVAIQGNPVSKSRMEAAGCRVSEINGDAICIPGAGGPTCLTRPLWRA